jgi:hypothetical protein
MKSDHIVSPKSLGRKLGLATVTILGQGFVLSLEAGQSWGQHRCFTQAATQASDWGLKQPVTDAHLPDKCDHLEREWGWSTVR